MHHVIESPQDGQRIDLSAGDSVELRLPQPGATGYRWSVHSAPPDVVEVHSDAGDSLADDTTPAGPPGAARVTAIGLVATAPGEGELTLTLARPWEDEPARTLTLSLAVG